MSTSYALDNGCAAYRENAVWGFWSLSVPCPSSRTNSVAVVSVFLLGLLLREELFPSLTQASFGLAAPSYHPTSVPSVRLGVPLSYFWATALKVAGSSWNWNVCLGLPGCSTTAPWM